MTYPKHRQPGTLAPAEVATEWEPYPLDKFGLLSFHAAISAVLPDAPCVASELETLVNAGKVKVAGICWHDRLCALVAWTSGEPNPPDEALQRGYRTSVQTLANLPRYQAMRDFGDLPPEGNA